ncbi:37S ribosomal protein SWS2, mitochondrial [Curvularia clavata]|uniref:37S ribosomal protein SWS2, mitochondrial n=1 Tax=Curvularia clavata TaxID=95742 RepID=A0A9Q8ZE53_CURCL|nr:37S ribosomal protein SWS2, mitochondrial [Curvularia clavata]
MSHLESAKLRDCLSGTSGLWKFESDAGVLRTTSPHELVVGGCDTMVFINGFSFTEATLVKRSLESFFGIGPSVSQRIMAKFHIHPWAKVGSLKNATVMDLTAELANMKIENDLRRQVQDDIRRLRDMGTYRGRRHAMGLPARGQRTRTQIATARRLNKIERGGTGRVSM